jgi:hypothetical protein
MCKSVTAVALLWDGIYYDLHIENIEEIKMREVKFKYVWKMNGSVATGVYNLDEIECGNCVAPTTKGIKWELVGRLQSTGIFDSNKVEMFEGDIVHDSNFVDDCNHVIDILNQSGGWFIVDIKEGYAEPLCDFSDSCKIIGNIHQNPELLK